jgi:hypothetical protein|tara:strand:- start:428 stop:853 length:426 start_codon:yes stop_codon:yes gene_type:complete
MTYEPENLILLKLSTGESIIGSAEHSYEDFEYSGAVRIFYPLKIKLMSRMSRDVDSLNLSPWVHPMSENEWVDVNPAQIVMSTLPSIGLTRYYNYCVSKISSYNEELNIEEFLEEEPTDDQLSEIELKEALDKLNDPITIH